jgi:polysaccharide biosynthesis PFTS motif protein
VLLPRLSRMVDVAALTPSSVLRLLRISLSGILRARDFRILHELLTTALIAAILSRNTPKCVLSSTTFLHGEPTMYAAAHLKIRSVMLHYGINTLLPKLTTDTEDPREHLIMGRTLVTDHVVWDELHARWFREQYASSGHTAPMFHATGPLMFCSINFNFSYLRDRFTVGVFDVIPPSFIHSLQLGYGAGVYTMSAVEEFWNEIADCLSDLRIGSRELRVVIKQKRELNPRMHDARYQEHLEALQTRAIGRFLEFRKPSENPWKTITSCDVVIGVPYTSMVSAADYLGLPACFFYPGNRVVKSQFKTPLLAGNRLELRQFLEAAVEGASRETPTLLPAPRLLQEVHDKVRSVIQA